MSPEEAEVRRLASEVGRLHRLLVAAEDRLAAQERVIEAARDIQRICSRKGLGSAVARTRQKYRLDAALRELDELAAGGETETPPEETA